MQLIDVARSIEISAVQTEHSIEEVRKAAGLAKEYDFSVVYSLPGFTKDLSEMLKGSSPCVGGVVSFPSGAEMTAVRVKQAELLLADGAQDFDMVLNIGYLKSGRGSEARSQIEAVKKVIGGDHPLKVILEVSLLTDDEIKTACSILLDGGADYVKTGTGWKPGPTTFRHIELIAETVQGKMKMKASGGVRGLDMLLKMMEMGVSRFGIRMDAAVSIYNEAKARFGK